MRETTIKLTKDGKAIRIGTIYPCSASAPHLLHVHWGKTVKNLVLADHSLVWPQHQTTSTKAAYEAIAALVRQRGSLKATVDLGHPCPSQKSPRPSRPGAARSLKKNGRSTSASRAAVGKTYAVACTPRLKPWKGISISSHARSRRLERLDGWQALVFGCNVEQVRRGVRCC